MSPADLKAMYDYYSEVLSYYKRELRTNSTSLGSTGIENYKNKINELTVKTANVGKALHESVELNYEMEIDKNEG
jgi:hypothetical protein